MNYKKFSLLVFTALLVVLLSACSGKLGGSDKVVMPVDKGYADGKQIYFAHTEVSNEEVAKMLTEMMKSSVPYVPGLFSVPDESLANVYSFTNGVKGDSMAGFQLSVFDNPPGTDGYSPLRRLNNVTWTDESKARELKSTAEILTAAEAGELVIKQPGIVINAPFILWDGGKR